MVLQQELVKRCPDDQVIKEFSKFLPDEVRDQMRDKDAEESYYDEESDGGVELEAESKSSSSESEAEEPVEPKEEE